MISTWPDLRAFALGLNLPEVTLATPWGHEALKAHGKLWCYWSAYADAAVFKADRDERDMLMQADPETFFLHPQLRPPPPDPRPRGPDRSRLGPPPPHPPLARRRPETLAQGMGCRPPAALTLLLHLGPNTQIATPTPRTTLSRSAPFPSPRTGRGEGGLSTSAPLTMNSPLTLPEFVCTPVCTALLHRSAAQLPRRKPYQNNKIDPSAPNR